MCMCAERAVQRAKRMYKKVGFHERFVHSLKASTVEKMTLQKQSSASSTTSSPLVSFPRPKVLRSPPSVTPSSFQSPSQSLDYDPAIKGEILVYRFLCSRKIVVKQPSSSSSSSLPPPLPPPLTLPTTTTTITNNSNGNSWTSFLKRLFTTSWKKLTTYQCERTTTTATISTSTQQTTSSKPSTTRNIATTVTATTNNHNRQATYVPPKCYNVIVYAETATNSAVSAATSFNDFPAATSSNDRKLWFHLKSIQAILSDNDDNAPRPYHLQTDEEEKEKNTDEKEESDNNDNVTENYDENAVNAVFFDLKTSSSLRTLNMLRYNIGIDVSSSPLSSSSMLSSSIDKRRSLPTNIHRQEERRRQQQQQQQQQQKQRTTMSTTGKQMSGKGRLLYSNERVWAKRSFYPVREKEERQQPQRQQPQRQQPQQQQQQQLQQLRRQQQQQQRRRRGPQDVSLYDDDVFADQTETIRLLVETATTRPVNWVGRAVCLELIDWLIRRICFYYKHVRDQNVVSCNRRLDVARSTFEENAKWLSCTIDSQQRIIVMQRKHINALTKRLHDNISMVNEIRQQQRSTTTTYPPNNTTTVVSGTATIKSQQQQRLPPPVFDNADLYESLQYVLS